VAKLKRRGALDAILRVLGVAIVDLPTGQNYFLHADEVLPTASSIKIAILAGLSPGAAGKIKLGDL